MSIEPIYIICRRQAASVVISPAVGTNHMKIICDLSYDWLSPFLRYLSKYIRRGLAVL